MPVTGPLPPRPIGITVGAASVGASFTAATCSVDEVFATPAPPLPELPPSFAARFKVTLPLTFASGV